jgi:hypothetical protein
MPSMFRRRWGSELASLVSAGVRSLATAVDARDPISDGDSHEPGLKRGPDKTG